ncbi:MAG: YegS/Rv2252/BmrU family lipid kinase [Micropruina sp.]|nr:YegS/Rv2252/BmrU family lipid kinase [Micropruina sp.]
MTRPASVTLVVNPSAGRGRARRLLQRVCRELVASLPGVTLRLHQSRDYADARLRCEQAVSNARDHRDALVVMGGDGMMHLGLNACATTQVPLGLIPAGSGNDFAGGLGVPTDVAGAVRTISRGVTRRIDLLQVSGALLDGAEHRFVGCILSTGFDSLVGRRANRVTLPLGPLVYAWATLAELSVFEPLSYRLVIDGQAREVPAMMVCVGNTPLFGGGMQGCPQADPTDGLLDLTIIHPVSRTTLLRLLPSMYTGGFIADPAVELLRAKQVRLDGVGLFGAADGEELGPVPLGVQVAPGVLSVFVP